MAAMRMDHAGFLGRRPVERQSRREKRPMIVREFEPVLPLDAGELCFGQSRPDLATSGPGQVPCGLLSETSAFAADHGATLASECPARNGN